MVTQIRFLRDSRRLAEYVEIPETAALATRMPLDGAISDRISLRELKKLVPEFKWEVGPHSCLVRYELTWESDIDATIREKPLWIVD